MQNQDKFKAKGWARSRVRDFYDIFCIFTKYRDEINIKDIKKNFIEKCCEKGIKFTSPEQFFDEKYLKFVKNDWQEFLGGLIGALPDFGETISRVKIVSHEILN